MAFCHSQKGRFAETTSSESHVVDDSSLVAWHRSKGIDPKGTKMMRRLTVGRAQFFWKKLTTKNGSLFCELGGVFFCCLLAIYFRYISPLKFLLRNWWGHLRLQTRVISRGIDIYIYKCFYISIISSPGWNSPQMHRLWEPKKTYIYIYLDPPRGAKWMVRGATKQPLRVQTPPLGGSWYNYWYMHFLKHFLQFFGYGFLKYLLRVTSGVAIDYCSFFQHEVRENSCQLHVDVALHNNYGSLRIVPWTRF